MEEVKYENFKSFLSIFGPINLCILLNIKFRGSLKKQISCGSNFIKKGRIRTPCLKKIIMTMIFTKKKCRLKDGEKLLFNKDHSAKSVQIRSYFWSFFPCIRTEYGNFRSKSSYSVQIQENTDQK